MISITSSLHECLCTFISIRILRMRTVLDKNCRENRNTHFTFNKFLPKIVSFMRECAGGGGHKIHCCVSTATLVTRKKATLLRNAYIADLVADSNFLGCKTAFIRTERPTCRCPTRTLISPWRRNSTNLPDVGNHLPIDRVSHPVKTWLFISIAVWTSHLACVLLSVALHSWQTYFYIESSYLQTQENSRFPSKYHLFY